jgi:hypothetical protein
LWTGRWCGPTSTLPVPGGGRPRPTWTRGALVDPDQPGDRDREALGRSRGGYSTKLHLRVEGRGGPMVILATAGAAPRGADAAQADGGRGGQADGSGPAAVAGDKGYSHLSLRRYLRRRASGR